MTKKKKTTSTSKASGTKGKKKTKRSSSKADCSRSNQRVPVQLLVDYQSDGSFLFDFCRDLGTGGIFIETNEPLPQGSDVELTFTIPDSKETLNARGEVIWVQDRVPSRKDLTPGMGVQFSKFDTDQRKVLEDFVHRYGPDPLHTSGSVKEAG